MSEVLAKREVGIREEIFIISTILRGSPRFLQLEDIRVAVVEHGKRKVVFTDLLFELGASFFSRHVAKEEEGDSVERV